LDGVVVLRNMGGRTPLPYFEVSFRSHPWLANQRRKSNPYYFLEGPVSFWRQFQNKPVEIICRANGSIVTRASGDVDFEISLAAMKVFQIDNY
jgi:hypothetical protein